ncbi:MAG: autotransporter outer membrane beta-barrel domain-containing protein [Synechococcus sp. SB0675_bin_7]|nr:autotransporter outer membrane beta-barrel domain-containing protein [Synechococcus sp. SB0675_bin_7]
MTVTAGEDSDTANELETLRATASGGGYDLTANVTVTVTDNDDDLPPSSTPPSSTPVVAIMGGSAITEGEDASFTLTATPAPAPGTNINVAVTISDSGSFARTGQIGSRVVSINDSGTTSFTVSTENDSVDEEDGRITVVVQGGTDHRPHGSNAVASVTVGDDDAPAVMAPNGWHLRFGRTVSQQVLDALQGRFAARPTAGLALTVAGEAITSAPPLEEHEGVLAKALGFETITTEALVQGSSFSFTPSAEGAAPQPAFWGQGTLASFTGQEAAFSLDGDVTTALLGADWSTERWRAGAALSHSWGSGSYEAEKDTDQEISSTLTGLFPYGRYGLTPRLGIWAVAGYGWGQLSLEPDGTDGEYQPGANLTMAAVGLDGLLIDGGAEGLNLTTTTDLLTLSTTSEEVDGVQSSEGSVSRLRLGLVATRPVPLAHGASLLPSLEIGVRQDSGDAETGFGLELGAGLTWEDPQHGISAQVRGRTLLTHADEDFREQGMALSFFWQPHPSHRGPSFSLSHAVGATAAGGMDALLRPTVIEGLDGPGNGQRLEAEAAYGFPAFADRLTLTPALALALSPDSSTYGLLWSVAPYSEQAQAGPWEVSLEGQRHEHVSSASPADHSLNLRFSLLF